MSKLSRAKQRINHEYKIYSLINKDLKQEMIKELKEKLEDHLKIELIHCQFDNIESINFIKDDIFYDKITIKDSNLYCFNNNRLIEIKISKEISKEEKNIINLVLCKYIESPDKGYYVRL